MQSPLHRRRLRRRGYSLLEILVVISIIALLSSAIGVALWRHFTHARIETTRQSALQLRRTAINFKLDHADDCPTVELLRQGDYIDAASKLTDAWDQPFIIKCDERGEVHVASSGPDKTPGTPDDIVAPEPPGPRVARE
jgi:prepilin-type N-terminal cleavage/methylation domain-containing protein